MQCADWVQKPKACSELEVGMWTLGECLHTSSFRKDLSMLVLVGDLRLNNPIILGPSSSLCLNKQNPIQDLMGQDDRRDISKLVAFIGRTL